MRLSIVFLNFIFLFSACSVKEFNRFEHNKEDANIITAVSDDSYLQDKLFEWKIQQGDRIEITAFNQSSNGGGQLSALLNSGGQRINTTRIGDEGILIGQAGTVNLPLIGSISIAGLTENEAAEKLMYEYKKYLRNPYVSVKLLNQRLFVLGEVKQPGVHLVNHGTMTLFEALASSGDVTDFADRTNIKIIRDANMRQPIVHEIDMTDYKAMKISSLILRPNDVVYVAPREDRATTIGYQEELPWIQVLSGLLQPFLVATTIYGVTK